MVLPQNCIDGLDSLPRELTGCVLTIGNFDGVHRGHQRILQTARELAAPQGLAVAALTFEPPPDMVLRPVDAPQRLLPAAEKARQLLAAGADWVVTAPASPELFAMTPREFIDQVVIRRFAPRHIVEGPNFFFGRGRSGDVNTLAMAGAAGGFAMHVVEPVTLEVGGQRQRVSSTLVRTLVAQGAMPDAGLCLGRPYTLYGPVVAGAGQGRLLDFPTANLAPAQQALPPDGVYVGRARLGDAVYAAAVSVGNKPTLGPSPRVIEAFLLDAHGDFYNQYLALGFLQRLRGQERFDSMESLRRQIAKDVQSVREICQRSV